MTLRVVAHMASPLCGDAPEFDSILEFEMSQRLGLAGKIRKDTPVHEAASIHIPMLRRFIGGYNVACCSSPIYAPSQDRVEHYAKRLAVEHADDLSPDQRLVVAVGNSTYKSYRLPHRLRDTAKIAWFVHGHRRPIKSLLRSVQSIGKKRSQGFGRVKEWVIEQIPESDCYCWFAPFEGRDVLMRPLPFCKELPQGMIGFKRDFGACQPPYWHPDRYTEIVTPC